MDTKSLIGVSLCAVVLLVLASLSNVVGYQSVKSTVVNDSPLYKTRTQRATNQQTNSITSQYLGKGKGNLLRFPMRDNQIEILNKVIESIKKMDDETFERFTQLCIQKTRRDNTFIDTDPREIKQILYALRTQPNRININTTSLTIDWEPSVCIWSPNCPITVLPSICKWSLGCAITNIYIYLVTIIFLICLYIIANFPSVFPGCTVMCTKNYGGIRNQCR